MTPNSVIAYLNGGRTLMDRVSESLVDEFAEEHGLNMLSESKRFEHFSSYIAVRRQFGEIFNTEDVVTGSGSDTGIDAIAIIVNDSLVTDVETFVEQAEKAGSLDVTFIFVQAETSSSFDVSTIGRFNYGVMDFFKERPTLKRNEKINSAAEVMTAIFDRSSKFKRGNPVCRLYYITTGKWIGDQDLEARRTSVITDLESTRMFREVEFLPVDAAGLQRLYRQTKNAISREFLFVNKTVIPDVPRVKEAYIGFLPASEFVKLLRSESGDIMGGLFYDNVRDWLDFGNEVNDEIKTTLGSEARARFVLMNNGITIIARGLQGTGNKFLIEDYSIVNGCQTSHVLFDQRNNLDDSVMVPIRLIGTQDEEVINDIIRSTNRQTEVKEEQFYALQEFSKELETFFQSFPNPHKLYYERRTHQYDRLSIEKTRIVTPQTLIKAFAAMFLDEPHRTTRNYSALKAKVGTQIFAKGHRKEPYYVAAYALYKLEFALRTGRLDSKFRPAKFHILQAIRFISSLTPIPWMNSNEMERYCTGLMDVLWDAKQADDVITLAARLIDTAAGGNFHRDNIRTEPFTQKVLDTFKQFEERIQHAAGNQDGGV